MDKVVMYATKKTRNYRIMKLKNIMYTLLGAGLVGAVIPMALASAPKPKPTADVEAKITKAIKAVFPDAVIGTMGQETEDGISFYEVELTVKGNKVGADVTSDGTIIETEEATDMKLFPKAAADAIKKAAKGMKVTGGEITKTFAKGVKDDSTGDTQVIHVVKLAEPAVAYEVDVEKDGNEGELAVSADGKILESPKWAAKGESKVETGEKAKTEDKAKTKEKEPRPLVSVTVTVVSPDGKVVKSSKSAAKEENKDEEKD